jgi:hypothetical protein
MGTQQILLVVLGVIIVGVAIAVGISMFGSQAYNSNRQAVASELTSFATQVVQFWKTPASLGGGGSVSGNLTVAKVADYIGFNDANESTTNDSGEYRVISVAGTVVTLKGLGTAEKGGNKPLITTTVDVTNSAITTTVGTGSGF